MLGALFLALGLTELFQLRFVDFQHEVVVLAIFLFCFCHSVLEWGLRTAVWFLLIVYVTVAVAEGFFGEWLFGNYVFTDDCTLGPHWLFGKPLFLPIAWYVCAYPAWSVACSLVPGSKVNVVVWIVASVCTMSSNVVSDPALSTGGSAAWLNVAARKPEWIWTLEPGQMSFEGVPLSNFGGWFVVSLLYFGIALCCIELKRPKKDPFSVLFVNAGIAFFYLVNVKVILSFLFLNCVVCKLHPFHSANLKVAAFGFAVFPALLALANQSFLLNQDKRRL